MSEKIDEVAKAIMGECHRHGYLVSIPEDHQLWGNLARAAGAAMRVPTEEMVFSGIRGATGGVMCSWHSMIDEMLK